MKKRSPAQYAMAFYEVSMGQTGKNLRRIIDEFVRLLARDRKLKQADRIINEFIKYAKRQEGIKEIEVVSARLLKAETLQAIKEHFGKKVEAKEAVRAELLGGVVIRTEEMILDASLKTQLVKLKQNLS